MHVGSFWGMNFSGMFLPLSLGKWHRRGLQMNAVTSTSFNTPSQNYGARSTLCPFPTRLYVWMKPWDAPFLLQSVPVHAASTHKPNCMVATRPACYTCTSQDTQPGCALSDKCFICQREGCTSIRWELRSRLSCWAAHTTQKCQVTKASRPEQSRAN